MPSVVAFLSAGCRLVTADVRFARSIKDRTLRRHIVTLIDLA